LPPDIINVIKSRRVRWVGHVAGMGRREVYYKEIGLDSSISDNCRCSNDPSGSIKCGEFQMSV